jgi:hypothetical protein
MQYEELYFMNAVRVAGVSVQKGVAILRPQHVVFAPTEGTVNVAAAVAGGAVGAFAGFSVRVIPPSFPNVHAYLQHLAALQASDFDASVAQAVQAGAWLRLARETTRVERKKFLFRGDRLFLWFQQGKDSVRFDGPVERGREAHVLGMLTGWQLGSAVGSTRVGE